MREILFRGKGDKKYNDGMWYFGVPIRCYDGDCQICTDNSKRTVIPETIGQYTGLKDKNGAKIFDGDIVTMPRYGGGRHKSAVYFKGGKFAVDGSNYGFKDICPKNMQVIGNIYDNPELLGGKEDDLG